LHGKKGIKKVMFITKNCWGFLALSTFFHSFSIPFLLKKACHRQAFSSLSIFLLGKG